MTYSGRVRGVAWAQARIEVGIVRMRALGSGDLVGCHLRDGLVPFVQSWRCIVQ